MSSASGRYQSRFFNFIHQQSRRISEQCDRAVRQIHYATSWIAPAVTYPFYLLFQSTRKIARLPNRQDAPQLNASHPAVSNPDVDTPIQHVLDSVASPIQPPKEHGIFARFVPPVLMRLVTSGELKTTQPTCSTLQESHNVPCQRSIIQGIATQLTTRTLVLVTATNETLDVLTAQQQQNLQETILYEVAAYWRHQRLIHATPAKSLKSVDAPQPLAYIDQGLAQIETNYLTSISKVAIAFTHHRHDLMQRWQQSSNNIATPTTQTDLDRANFQHHGLNFQTLIWAAIDFFFGSRSNNIGKSESQQTPQLPPPPNRKIFPHRRIPKLSASETTSSIEDPWLSSTDLFGESVETTQPRSQETQTLHVLPEDKTSNSLYNKLRNGWQRFKPKAVISALAKINQQDKTSAIASTISGTISQPNDTAAQSSTQMNPAPDWIEISATTMGYVKHPLEQLLAWLDQAMLWLEEVLFKVWRWLSRFAFKH